MFADIEKAILIFTLKSKGNITDKTFLRKNTFGGIIALNFKTHYIDPVMVLVWDWWRGEHIEQCNRIENSFKLSQTIYTTDF